MVVTVVSGQTAVNTGQYQDANGDPVTLTASLGTVVNNGDGTWSWSFVTSGPATSQTVSIFANDGRGGNGQAMFTLTVTAPPQAPPVPPTETPTA
jgi:hypothetical protein